MVRYDKDSATLVSLGYREGLYLKFKVGNNSATCMGRTSPLHGLKKPPPPPASWTCWQDLGPQIGYRTVFVLEYLGPILIVLAYATRPALLYGADASAKPWEDVARLSVAAWLAHFLKREFETFFVHRFSRPTMPLANLFKNCWYYWGFALAIGFPLAHPAYTPPGPTAVKVGAAIFALSELGNLTCHVMLRNLRPAEGSKQRPIPSGFLFDLVSCPNYTFEVSRLNTLPLPHAAQKRGCRMTSWRALLLVMLLLRFRCWHGWDSA